MLIILICSAAYNVHSKNSMCCEEGNLYDSTIVLHTKPIFRKLKLENNSGLTIVSITIFDREEQEVPHKWNNGFSAIDLEQMSQGHYTIRIKLENGISIERQLFVS